MQDHDEGGAQQRAETLQAGPSRPSLFEKIPATWRRPEVALLAFLLGVAAGGGAVLWWHARPAPPATRAHEHAVELVLFGVTPPRTQPGAPRSEFSPLHAEGALLLSGGTSSTVLQIDALDRSLEVRAPDLPLTVSPAGRFQPVDLRIIVRDCDAATRWAPGDRPFTIIWRDEFGGAHLDRAGDFDRSLAVSLVRYIETLCENPPGS